MKVARLGRARFVLVVALPLLGSAAVAQDVPTTVPAPIVAQLERLRQSWPEVPRAEMRNDHRFGFDNDSIKLGAKALAEVEAAPENVNGVVLAFLLGREAWRAVQTAHHTPAEIYQMRRNRMRECEADFMGGAAAYRFLAAMGLDERSLELAHHGLTTYVSTKAVLANLADTYPAAKDRVSALAIGWGQARSPGLIRYAGRDSPPGSEAERADDTCRKITGISDGSRSLLEVNWAYDIPHESGPIQTLKTIIENRSWRAVTVSTLIASWLRYYRPPPSPDDRIGEPVAFDVLDYTINLAPREKRVFTFEMRNFVSESRSTERAYYSHASFLNPVVSRYAAPLGPIAYCLGRISAAPGFGDRSRLAKIGTIAMAAKEDFEPVANEPMSDVADGQMIKLIPGARLSDNDRIHVSRLGNSVSVTLLESEEDEPAIAEYKRMKALLEAVCGYANIVDETPTGWDPEERILRIGSFAAGAAVQLFLVLNRRDQVGSDGTPAKGGSVFVSLHRDSNE